MKKILLWVFLFPILLSAQSTPIYTVQIGTYVNPKVADFSLLQPLGYLYAEPFGANFSKVFLGEFTNEALANNTLRAVQDRGFSGFVSQRSPVTQAPMMVVQFTTVKPGEPIDWATLSNVGKLYTVLTDPRRIKVVTGPFATVAAARQRVAAIQQMGYKDAFLKTINPRLLHDVGPFELGQIQVQRNLNTAVDAIINEDIPSNYEANSAIIPSSSNSSNIITGPPTIRPLIKRTSALDLQKALKISKHYEGSLDGFYGEMTAKGFEHFKETDQQYQKYALLANYFQEKTVSVSNKFQAIINSIIATPNTATIKLENINIPLAKAYQAYILMTNGGGLTEINQLMNAAIKTTFADKKIKNAPPFDYNATYSYENMEQFILHLRYLHAAPKHSNYAIPCWLFEQHPKAALAAFKTKSKFASFANTKISTCTNFDNWEPIKIMNTLIHDLQPAFLSKAQLAQQETLTAARNFQYLFPEKLTKAQKETTDKWLVHFWKQLDSSAAEYPVLGKNVKTLKLLFFQSQVLLEDYFMDMEFTPDAAEGLALSVLKTYVDVPLEVYGN